jgi:oligopeptide/dipeptide ABC transporter ATP-binding protein
VMYAGRIVEAGPVRRLFDSPAHPYTKALLGAIPTFGAARRRLTAVEGQPPDGAALPRGCAFHPRCPEALARCREDPPPEEFKPAADHVTRCWLWDGSARPA